MFPPPVLPPPTAVPAPGRPRRASRLPECLSWPVTLSIPPVALVVLASLALDPLAVLLTLVPGPIVVGSFIWLDGVEPEPLAERLHAFLWGATFAALCASVVNSVVAEVAGLPWAVVVSAPVGEEILKALGIVVAVRRRRLRSWFDGVVYAGFVAAGFALVENSVYFLEAAAIGDLPTVFALRGLATPFAHPLFSMFTGMFVGRFAASRSPLALLGLPVAIALHAGWNGASLLGGAYATGMLVSAFVLFWTVLVVLLRVRLRSTRVYAAIAPVLAFRCGFDPTEIALFADWSSIRRARRTLPRSRRLLFEELHAVVLRLGPYAVSPSTIPPDLLVELQRARMAFSDRRLPPPVLF